MSLYYAKAYMQERVNEAQRMRETRLARHVARSRGDQRAIGNTLGRAMPTGRAGLRHTTCEQTPLGAA